MKLSRILATVTAAVAFTAAASAIAQVTEITGAGATFPAPLYARWAADYNKATNVRMNYQSIGSGGGLRQILCVYVGAPLYVTACCGRRPYDGAWGVETVSSRNFFWSAGPAQGMDFVFKDGCSPQHFNTTTV
jgi:hypothetical protein